MNLQFNLVFIYSILYGFDYLAENTTLLIRVYYKLLLNISFLFEIHDVVLG